jgi:hypothetical protein
MANGRRKERSESSATQEFVTRSQKFLSGDTMVACSCGEIRVFPNARREGKCPRGNPWVCLAQLGLPLLSMTLEDSPKAHRKE